MTDIGQMPAEDPQVIEGTVVDDAPADGSAPPPGQERSGRESPGQEAPGREGSGREGSGRPGFGRDRPEETAGRAGDPRERLLGPQELQSVIGRWREIQAGFVDEPRQAVQDADALVAELMERITRMLAEQHERLEAQWTLAGGASTEDLRQGLRRYRSFFERLLSA